MSDELVTVWADWSRGTIQPTARIRERVYFDHPTIAEFCVQLEYNLAAGQRDAPADWRAVARFDHNVHPRRGHDIRAEGLHLDVFPGTTAEETVRAFRVVSLSRAPTFCREFLETNRVALLAAYERLGGIPPAERSYDD